MSLVFVGSSHVLHLEKAIHRLYSEGGKKNEAVCIPKETEFCGVSGMTLTDFNEGVSKQIYDMKKNLESCRRKTAILLAGGNDLDSGDVLWSSVLESLKRTVDWLTSNCDSVLVVRLLYRIYPRPGNRSWHLKYPGRGEYNELSDKVNDGLITCNWPKNVYVCRHVKMTDLDLSDGVHLTDCAYRKLLTSIDRGMKALRRKQVANT